VVRKLSRKLYRFEKPSQEDILVLEEVIYAATKRVTNVGTKRVSITDSKSFMR